MIRFLLPALGFAFVAIASFSVWAFGGKWLSSTTQLYSACAIVFLLFGGISLLPYSSSEGRKPLWKLVWAFPLSFLIFSILWCVGWFLFKSHFGEIMGSAFGIFAMVWLKIHYRLQCPTARSCRSRLSFLHDRLLSRGEVLCRNRGALGEAFLGGRIRVGDGGRSLLPGSTICQIEELMKGVETYR